VKASCEVEEEWSEDWRTGYGAVLVLSALSDRQIDRCYQFLRFYTERGVFTCFTFFRFLFPSRDNWNNSKYLMWTIFNLIHTNLWLTYH